MYELIKITENDYYIQSPTRIGVVKLGEDEVCIIDSGCDKDVGKKVRRVLDENGWKLRCIYVTHSHADHIGGNKYLQEQTGCQIFAKGIECDYTNHPILESTTLFAGFPFKELRHKFLFAQESNAEPLNGDIIPQGFEIISLPGHSFDMVGFRTPDDTVYLADALSSRQTIDKYKIGYIYDVKSYLQTLEKVKTLKAKMFVPSHVEPCADITQLAQYNIDKTNEIAEKIISLCGEPIYIEDLLQKLFYDLEMNMDFMQYVLVGSTVRSYLSYLKDDGHLIAEVSANRLLWRRA